MTGSPRWSLYMYAAPVWRATQFAGFQLRSIAVRELQDVSGTDLTALIPSSSRSRDNAQLIHVKEIGFFYVRSR
ncbi:hypothetical protein GWI33_006714 [Rhynchophorus ferrugineus]|uniref:Uncharacterized protein n=1 Tax=Rhynchophorus ferrugineus TaxID=354439 RepID=A0A834MNV9_RHYFE|nr:hypothetical protein GWI33_006714 [Rhynchophorus ferrugineus]